MNQRQRLFAEAYLANPNATQAALAAGYSEKTAYSQGQRLLKNVEIQKALGKRVEDAVITANEILEDVKAIAKTAERDGDRLKAYEMLGKHLAMWTDNIKHGGEMSQKIVVEYVDDGKLLNDANG